MSLTVHLPNGYPAERRYAVEVLLREFLGLDYDVVAWEEKHVRVAGPEERAVVLPDGLFATPEAQWMTPASLPRRPLKVWNVLDAGLDAKVVRPQLPVIYGEDPDAGDFFEVDGRCIRLGLDIFGSAFFMLTRYEELVTAERDEHDRFRAVNSLAYQEGFLDRPIVNEYLEVIWACFERLWPGLSRRKRDFRLVPSHDVDFPFLFRFGGLKRLAKTCGTQLIRDRSPGKALRSIKQWLQVRSGNLAADPANAFDFLMDQSERNGLISAFYFICDNTAGELDGEYDVGHPSVRALLRKIHDRGHEIGLHGSYNTYLDPVQTTKEFTRLKAVCAEEGIEQNHWGGRQHFLRWRTPVTFRNGDSAGLAYDTTLGFADRPGFRCGTCYEYPVFDIVARQPLALRERPLIVMDATLQDRQFMNLGDKFDEIAAHIVNYRERCRRFDGQFTFLWHNNRLAGSADRSLYTAIFC